MQYWKGTDKKKSFADDMIIYQENPKETSEEHWN